MFENQHIRPSKNPKALLYCQLTFKAFYVFPSVLDKIFNSRDYLFLCISAASTVPYPSRSYISIYLIFIGLSSAESPYGTQPTPALEKEESPG